VTFVVKEYRRQ